MWKTRINGIFCSPAFNCVFKDTDNASLIKEVETTLKDANCKLLRIDLSGIPFEYKAREIISNVIGRFLLNQARKNAFEGKPLIVFLDEAHNFLGKTVGGEDTVAKLDALELIAKEGRKFGLNICLATQRPRDITEGVLSQVGTMIVHRLTNDRDREVVERACGEIDRAASAFLPNLKPGEAAIIGNDFPIPLTIQISEPVIHPRSKGPDFQKAWR
ncbi:MAG TPA: ATP-binding protein [Chitinispirillaceae bacterium]|nr:ATP-binding protein [Chitinispirillaceae bacterium]